MLKSDSFQKVITENISESDLVEFIDNFDNFEKRKQIKKRALNQKKKKKKKINKKEIYSKKKRALALWIFRATKHQVEKRYHNKYFVELTKRTLDELRKEALSI